MRRILPTLLLVTLLCGLAGVAHAWQTERVVLVLIDGLRYSEGLGDPDHVHVPAMAALAGQGAIVEPFQNLGVTYTDHAVPSVWCGGYTDIFSFSDPDCGGSSNNYTELPSLFEYFRKQLDRPETDCVYVLKDVGCPWRGSMHPDYGPDWWPLYHMAGSSDTDVWNQAQSVLQNESPTLMFLYLADVDHYGHSGNWTNYLSAIDTADAIVGDLWTLLQSLPAYAGKTTLLVTNDHGRHDYDFSGHGDGCAGCRTIQLLAVGPDVKTGFVSTTPRDIPDVTPTIAALLGFQTEYATGAVMDELLVETAAELPAGGGPALAAWPNPLRASTTLRLALADARPHTIEIVDVAGRRVDRIDLPAGITQLTWTPPADLASGVYLARVAGQGDAARALVVLR